MQLSWCPFIRGSTARVLAVSLALPPPPPTLSVPLPSEMQLFAGQGEPLPATDPTGPQSDLKSGENTISGEATQVCETMPWQGSQQDSRLQKFQNGAPCCFWSKGLYSTWRPYLQSFALPVWGVLPALWISSPKWTKLYDDERLLC